MKPEQILFSLISSALASVETVFENGRRPLEEEKLLAMEVLSHLREAFSSLSAVPDIRAQFPTFEWGCDRVDDPLGDMEDRFVSLELDLKGNEDETVRIQVDPDTGENVAGLYPVTSTGCTPQNPCGECEYCCYGQA